MAGILDTDRYTAFLVEALDISPKEIHALLKIKNAFSLFMHDSAEHFRNMVKVMDDMSFFLH
ncbi:MAG TPA: hypothetical protein PK692_07035 [Bacteroidales bacterium]|nr:hypothetical protein [Bacteroidales bacterium]HQO07793.1 hypothetical protein [Bacteroidales bacterium]HQP53652.1 hypothetical protein [Bacteroidales bacterium]